MYVFISILILISSILLVLIVLVQNSKGGGLASGFSSSNQVLGVRKTTDFLEKATWSLAGFLVLLCISITAVIPDKNVSTESEVLQNVSAPINTAVPGFETSLPQEAVPVEIPATQGEPIAVPVEIPAQ